VAAKPSKVRSVPKYFNMEESRKKEPERRFDYSDSCLLSSAAASRQNADSKGRPARRTLEYDFSKVSLFSDIL